jgi:hypothetical protein
VQPMGTDPAPEHPERLYSEQELRDLTGVAQSNTELVKLHFDEAQLRAAQTITGMATGSIPLNQARLKAAIYVVEFVHGPVSRSSGSENPWDTFGRAVEPSEGVERVGHRTDESGGDS